MLLTDPRWFHISRVPVKCCSLLRMAHFHWPVQTVSTGAHRASYAARGHGTDMEELSVRAALHIHTSGHNHVPQQPHSGQIQSGATQL